MSGKFFALILMAMLGSGDGGIVFSRPVWFVTKAECETAREQAMSDFGNVARSYVRGTCLEGLRP